MQRLDTMTAMSRFVGPGATCGHRRGAISLRSGWVARAVLSFVGGMQVACLIPPDLEPASQDAGSGSPLVILSAQPIEFAFPGPILLERPDDQRLLSLEVQDGDTDDTLFVRLYVDYNRPPASLPTPAYAECQAAPNATATRFIQCSVNALCTPIDGTDDGNHVLEAMVSDRPFISDADPQAFGQPPYRAVADPDAASSSISSWVMSCQRE